MYLINNCLDDFSKPLPFFSVWRQCMLRVRLFKWVGGEVGGGECVFVRICFFLRQVARYLPFAIYKEYCGCRVRK